MTAIQLLRVLGRRWYVLVIVAAITVFAIFAAQRVPGVYWTQVDVVFLPPKSANALEDQNTSIVQFVAVIEREFNGIRNDSRSASSSGTLYGEGVRSGWQVSFPNNGGQWQNNFNRPALSIEVVDASPTKVAAVAASLSKRVSSLVEQRQDRTGIAPENFVTTIDSPSPPVVRFIRGSDARASIALAALGAVVGVLSAALLDRVMAAARSRPRRRLRIGPARARSGREPSIPA
ncbi:MAG: hypothetical protein V4531_13575 [Actinomycetota bacterium]